MSQAKVGQNGRFVLRYRVTVDHSVNTCGSTGGKELLVKALDRSFLVWMREVN